MQPMDINAAAASDPVSQLRKRYQRDVNCLSDPDRSVRKQALRRLHHLLQSSSPSPSPSSSKSPSPEAAAALTFFHQTAVSPLLTHSFSDPVEYCRELAIDAVLLCIRATSSFSDSTNPNNAPTADPSLLDPTQACHALAERYLEALASRVGEVPFAEDSEEIREKLLRGLQALLDTTGGAAALGSKLGRVVSVLGKAVQDKAPETKQVCAQCCERLCEVCEGEVHLFAKALTVALLDHCLPHQRSKVRQAALRGVSKVVRCSARFDAAAFYELMDQQVMPRMQQVLVDRSAAVREELALQAASWMPVFKDDCPRLAASAFLLLVAGVADEHPTVQGSSIRMMRGMTVAYGEEDAPATTEVAQEEGEEGGWMEKPTAEMKSFARKHVEWLIPPLVAQSEDWTTAGRCRALRSLYVVLRLSEDASLRYISELLQALAAASADDDEDVRRPAGRCAEELGRFISMDAILATLSTNAARSKSKRADAGAMEVLAGVVRGAGSGCVAKVDVIVDLLLDASFGSGETEFEPLLRCTQELLVALKESKERIELQQTTRLARVLLLLASQPGFEEMTKAAMRSLPVLAEVAGFEGEPEMVTKIVPIIVEAAVEACAKWEKSSGDRMVFDRILRLAGSTVAQDAAMAGKVVQVFLTTGKQEAPVELRLVMLSLLHVMLSSLSTGSNAFIFTHGQTLSTALLLPNLSWRVGRVAGTVRKASMYCLNIILASLADAEASSAVSWVDENRATMLPVIRSCLDDMEPETRRFATHSMSSLLKLVSTTGDAVDLYHDLVKRLDDANDEVRIMGCHALISYCRCADKEMIKGTAFTYILDACFIHLDDQNPDVRSAVHALIVVLIELDIDTPSVETKAQKERLCHRTPQYCDDIIKIVQARKGGMSG